MCTFSIVPAILFLSIRTAIHSYVLYSVVIATGIMASRRDLLL
ncbi:MAG: hypothetical protein WDO16_04035 [Bacteroidota bacterium]